ncbi:hypothetical protein Prudu_018770, partial [Prunus dulcis]
MWEREKVLLRGGWIWKAQTIRGQEQTITMTTNSWTSLKKAQAPTYWY